MPHNLDQEIRQTLARYLSGNISLAEFSRWFAPLAWRAEELAGDQPDLAAFAGQIDLRLAEYSDHYWTEAQLRDLLGSLIDCPAPSVHLRLTARRGTDTAGP